jgi:Na+-transporting NADH:ubiquinone oxidoreductase subunit NqrF
MAIGTELKFDALYGSFTLQNNTKAFLDELVEAQKRNANFTFIGSITDMQKSKKEWKGETGFFTKEMPQKYAGDLSLPIYYIAGPPAIVASIRKTLTEAGVDEDNIRTEEFSGY